MTNQRCIHIKFQRPIGPASSSEATVATIGMMGLGAMGGRMAARLIEAGHTVRVWNRTAARAQPLVAAGATHAATPREAVLGADFALAMVRDDEASRTVWLDQDTGALAGLAPSTLAIEGSTLSLDWTRELGRAFDQAGRRLIDAPVAGSRPQAEAGQLIFMVGGAPADVDRARPVLNLLGAAVHHAGPAGSGAVVKLAVNALFGVQVAAVAELIAMLDRAGAEPGAALDILAATPVCSPAAKGAGAAMLAGQFAPLFPVELVEKDLGYALAAAGDRSGAPAIAAVQSVFSRAVRAGLGAQNLNSVVRLYRPALQPVP
jgi:3-hydroxyisobutyrate dehydrogenase-like beta-hydroxyacid dehydrogenase